MTQSVTIPANATSAFMRFDHAYDFEFDVRLRLRRRRPRDQHATAAPFADVGALLTDVGYSGTLRGSPSNNPIAGPAAFVRRQQRLPREPRDADVAQGRERAGSASAIGTDGGRRRHRLDHRRRPHLLVRRAARRRRTATATACRTRATPARRRAGTLPNGCTPSGGGADPGSGSTGGGSTGGGRPVAAHRRHAGRREAALVQALRNRQEGAGALHAARVRRRPARDRDREAEGQDGGARRPSARRRPACSRSSPRRRCDKGTYKVTIVLRDADGNKRTLKKSFKVK